MDSGGYRTLVEILGGDLDTLCDETFSSAQIDGDKRSGNAEKLKKLRRAEKGLDIRPGSWSWPVRSR